MGSKDFQIDGGSVRYRGVFDMQKLNKTIINFYLGHGYKHSETKYKAKHGAEGTKVEAGHKGFRKTTEWIKTWTYVEIQVRNLRKVEVIRNGEKKEMDEGTMLIKLRGEIETDPFDRFKTGWLSQIKHFINEYILKRETLFVHVDNHQLELLKFHRVIKDCLEFETAYSAKG